MPRPTHLVAALAAALLMAACTGGDPTGGPATVAGPDPLVTTPLSVLGSEETVTVASLADGRPAVVNFWASWCEFCIDEMPDLEQVFQDLDGKVAFVGVDREDRVALALELAVETGVTYPLVEDPDGTFFEASRGLGMPTTLFLTAEGTVAFRHSGPLTAGQLADLVAQHLGVEA